nr:hypothetical protein [Tanacetum cinerariifolium]
MILKCVLNCFEMNCAKCEGYAYPSICVDIGSKGYAYPSISVVIGSTSFGLSWIWSLVWVIEIVRVDGFDSDLGHHSRLFEVDGLRVTLHDLKDMVVKLGYGVEDLMYFYFLIPSLGLDYGLHSLNADANVLEMSKYVKDFKIILVYVKHGSSIVHTSMFDSSPDVNMNVRKDFVARPIVVESVVDLLDGLDEILGDYVNTENEITWKQMIVHVGNDASGSDLEDLDYDPKHDDAFDDDEPIAEEVYINMNNFSFTADPKHDTRQQLASKEIVKGRVKKHSVETRRQLILVKNDNERVRVICEGTIPALVPYVAIDINMDKNVFSQTKGSPAIRENNNSGKQNILGTTIRIDVQQEPNPESLTRIFRRVYVCLGALKQGFRACGREILGLDGCFMSGPWPGQILTTVEADANNGIYLVAYAIVEAESKASWCWFLNLLGEDLGRAKCDLLINNICGVFNRQLVDGIDQPIITYLEYIREYLMKRIMATEYNVQWNGGFLYQVTRPYKDQYVVNMDRKVCSCRKWELTGVPCKYVVAAIYNMAENSVGVVVESRTVIIPPLYKPPIGRPPKKRKKSNNEIASQSASLGKLSRKGKSVSCGKCGNVGHNRKGCRGQGGDSSQTGARKVFGQAACSRKVSNQAVGARNVSGQAVDARKASSQPSIAQSSSNQGPRQGFRGAIAGLASGSQRKTKKLVDL